MDKQLLEQEAKEYTRFGGGSDYEPNKWPFIIAQRAYIAGATSSSTVKNLEREVERLKGLIGYAHQIGFSRGRTQNITIESSWQQFKLNNGI